MIDKQAAIVSYFRPTDLLVEGKQYHTKLPAELQDWYCYWKDGGHAILAFVEGRFDESNPEVGRLEICPVKEVLRSYRIMGDFIVVPGQYSDIGNLIFNDDDFEF